MKLGNLILKYRKQKNLSQEELAKEIGVTRQTKNIKNYSNKMIIKIKENSFYIISINSK